MCDQCHVWAQLLNHRVSVSWNLCFYADFSLAASSSFGATKLYLTIGYYECDDNDTPFQCLSDILLLLLLTSSPSVLLHAHLRDNITVVSNASPAVCIIVANERERRAEKIIFDFILADAWRVTYTNLHCAYERDLWCVCFYEIISVIKFFVENFCGFRTLREFWWSSINGSWIIRGFFNAYSSL